MLPKFQHLMRNYISGILFGIIILILSVIPISVGEKTSFFMFPGSDKIAHAGLYCIFAALLSNDFLRTNGFKTKKLLVLLASVLVYSVLIEVIQYLEPYRSGEILDALANFLGIVIGGAAVYYWRKFKS